MQATPLSPSSESAALFISADIEGVAGVVSTLQTRATGFEFEAARRWMTEDVLAVITGAGDCGVRRYVVADSHGTGQNLLLDALPPTAELVRSWPRPLMMMQGVEAGDFAGAALVGYHGPSHQIGAGLGHTLFLEIRELRLNGLPASETTLSAAIAGHFQVPILIASGDGQYCEHVRALLPGAIAVETAQAYGWLSKRVLSRAVTRERLKEAITQALRAPMRPAPFVLAGPIEVYIDLTSPILAETLAFLPFIQRTASHAVTFVARDILEVSRFMAFFYDILVTRWRL